VALRRTHVGKSGRLPQPGSSRIRAISLPKLSGFHVVPARGSRDSGLRGVDAVSVSLGREESSRSQTTTGAIQPAGGLGAFGTVGTSPWFMNRSF
jgi:hypothetical protein